jgi:hypothetical protein
MDVGPLNWTRYQPGQKKGHYESFFQRGNHPTRPLAFWIRYTIFSPTGHPEKAIGELWAMFFNGETGRHIAVKEEHPLASCRFERESFGAQVGSAVLAPGKLRGTCTKGAHTLGWDLTYASNQAPIHFLPASLYEGKLPRAKSFVGVPMAVFTGSVTVDGERFEVEKWAGSQNHNWGSQHTDYYAFGQVAGFDNAPESFLEIVSAQLKFGPVWTPMLTPMVLRHRGKDHSFITLPQTLRANGKFHYFDWTFGAQNDEVKIEGRITAPQVDFVGLTYYNPPGGIKHCLNSKLADCQLTVTDKQAGRQESLTARHRAAFEIIAEPDDHTHGVAIQV